MLRKSITVLLVFLSGCASLGQDIKVMRSDGNITVTTKHVDQNSVLVCDKESCRVVER